MRKMFYTLLLILLFYGAKAQDSLRTEVLQDISIRFELPMNWTQASIQKTKSQSTIYTYTRKLAGQEKSSKATLSILVEHIKPSTSIRDYSLAGLKFFKQQKGFRINKTLVDSDGRFSLPYTVAYEAEYFDGENQKHHLFILHTIEFNHGAQLMIDFPSKEYGIYEEELNAIVKSLRYQR